MKKTKKIVALLLALVIIAGIAVFSVSAVNTDDQDSTAEAKTGITVHYYQPDGVPTIYYWNSLPKNLPEIKYPGEAMTSDGKGWYSKTFPTVSKINMIFVTDGKQSDELTRQRAGEYWYKNNKWTSYDPDGPIPSSDVDMREETIYFVITTRFYDGDSGNNVHCWDDGKAGNTDGHEAWKGDFRGLIDKLDYIKALGFSAIWITPVVTNASGYDYHGYHAFDFSTIDARYESNGATYDDLIEAVHDKGMKLIQDVVWNHTGNFGEANLCPMFEKVYDDIHDLETTASMKVIPGSELDTSYPGYDTMEGGAQFQARLDIMQSIHNEGHDMNEAYHRERSGAGWGQPLEQYCSIEGDCRDLNTENPNVVEYLTDTSLDLVNRGVDGFRLDTEKHINRWTLNSAFFPKFADIEGFYIFGEVCARWSEFINEGGPSDSPFFYTWKETGEWANNWGNSFSDWENNFELSKKHYSSHMNKSTSGLPTSTNAFLSGNEYHEPNYSQANGTGVIDFTMHWNFKTAEGAFNTALGEDSYFNDSTWNVVYVDSHDYGPNTYPPIRYNEGTDAWAENLALMFTFRGIPCVYYGSEIEFKKGAEIDVGTNAALDTTGRAYYGDHLEGNVEASDFSEYTADGEVANTLNQPLAKHIQRLNKIRRAIPALQKGQYSTQGVSGNMAFKRGYTDPETGKKSFVCCAVTNAATFTGIPNGTYIDAVTGTQKVVNNGNLSIEASGKGNMRCYVLSSNGYEGITGKIGDTGKYLK